MIDFLVKEKTPFEELKHFLAFIFNIANENILVISLADFYENEEADLANISCLCICSAITGDAKILVQLSRYDMPDEEFIKRLQVACKKFGIKCYIPQDSYSRWYFMNGNDSPEIVLEDEVKDEENYYSFKALNTTDIAEAG
jgi:hypothetical protein